MGVADRGPGRWALARTLAGAGSTRVQWILVRGLRLETELRLAPRATVVRVGAREGRTALRVELRAQRPALVRGARRSRRRTRSPRRTLARASFGVDLRADGWHARGGFRVDRLSLRPGAQISRSFAGPGGRWEPMLAASMDGMRREARAHISFTPRLALGPLRFHSGLGLRYLDTGKKASLRPALSGTVQLHWKILQAGLGWEIQAARQGFSVNSGLAGRLDFHPGPFDAFVRFRPARSNVGWSAGLSLNR